MPRRTNRKHSTRRDADLRKPPSLGSHWRADGTPKTAYRSQGEALAMADERRRISGTDLSVYRCDFCPAWHMGTTGGRVEQ